MTDLTDVIIGFKSRASCTNGRDQNPDNCRQFPTDSVTDYGRRDDYSELGSDCLSVKSNHPNPQESLN
jgi:hypothetical protein